MHRNFHFLGSIQSVKSTITILCELVGVWQLNERIATNFASTFIVNGELWWEICCRKARDYLKINSKPTTANCGEINDQISLSICDRSGKQSLPALLLLFFDSRERKSRDLPIGNLNIFSNLSRDVITHCSNLWQFSFSVAGCSLVIIFNRERYLHSNRVN